MDKIVRAIQRDCDGIIMWDVRMQDQSDHEYDIYITDADMRLRSYMQYLISERYEESVLNHLVKLAREQVKQEME